MSAIRVGSDTIIYQFEKTWDKETGIFFKTNAIENNKNFIRMLAQYPQYIEEVMKHLSDSELDAIVTFMENNCFTDDGKVTGLSLLGFPSDKSVIQTYFKLRAEQILRETDKIMTEHYKKWSNDKNVDVEETIKDLSQKNVDLIKEFSSRFGDSALDLFFFIDLVNTNKIWDIKNRTSSVYLNPSEAKIVKDKIGQENYNDALISSMVNGDIIESNLYSKKYCFNGKEIERDYIGNYHYGYIGGQYIDFTIPTLGFNENFQDINYLSNDLSKEVQRFLTQPLIVGKDITKDQILTQGASIAQFFSNLKNFKWGGDPPEDTQSILEGLYDFYKNNP